MITIKTIYLFLIGLVAGMTIGYFLWLRPAAATFDSCHWECGRYWRGICVDWDRVCPRPSPTPIPEPTPEPTPEVTPAPKGEDPAPQPCNGCGGAPVAPTCTGDPDVSVAPINFFIIRRGAEAEARWVPTGGSEVNLYYKEVKSPTWQYAVRDEKNDGNIVVGALNPKLGYTFGLQQRYHFGDGMTVTAVVKDGPSSQIFRVSEYLTW